MLKTLQSISGKFWCKVSPTEKFFECTLNLEFGFDSLRT